MSRFDKLLILGILGIATILRFYQFTDIPFTHDEFSVWSRLIYDNLNDILEKGVKLTDTHPAGVQVFLFYWTILFEKAEWVIKLPFAVMGIWSVWMIFIVAKKWFGKTTGFLSAAAMATLQYPIYYSQIARPYISGMFFGLVLVYFWSNIIKSPKRKPMANGIGFVLAGTLCAYNHHFSFLFAIIVGLSGFFFLRKNMIWKYVAYGIAVALLYLPHLNITLFQLGKGGVGAWLSKPDGYFIVEYVRYIFHFSNLLLFFTALVIVYGLFHRAKKPEYAKAMLLFASWVILPLLIGFVYSIKVSAVLQFSVLIFSFPFLLMLLFGHFKELSNTHNVILVSVLILANILTLIINRQHYRFMYESVYEELLLDNEEARLTNKKTLSLLSSNPLITDYYLNKHALDTHFVWVNDFENAHEFSTWLTANSSDYEQIYLGAVSTFDDRMLGKIIETFPKLKWKRDYFQGSAYVFSKADGEDILPFSSFEPPFKKDWNGIIPEQIEIDSTYGTYYRVDETNGWSPKLSVPLSSISTMHNDFILVKATGIAFVDQNLDIDIVTTVKQGDDLVEWKTTNLNTYKPDSLGNIVGYHVLDLSIVPQRHDDLTVNISLWNHSQAPFRTKQITVYSISGNPYLYWAVKPIYQTKK